MVTFFFRFVVDYTDITVYYIDIQAIAPVATKKTAASQDLQHLSVERDRS